MGAKNGRRRKRFAEGEASEPTRREVWEFRYRAPGHSASRIYAIPLRHCATEASRAAYVAEFVARRGK